MLSPLLAPSSIAVVGASRDPAKVGHHLLRNLIDSGYGGRILPVNPNTDTLLGLPCHPKVPHSQPPVDLALIIVPRETVRDAVRQCLDAGVKAMVVISTGFSEHSEEGAALERQIAEMCRFRKTLLLGPNCLGLINTGLRLNAFFGLAMPPAGGISLISQSSSLCAAFLDRLAPHRLGVAKVVSIGNKAGVTEIDLLKGLTSDPATRVIVAYLESISDGDEFVKTAEEASQQKPVIILKAATTDAGRRAVAAHSGMALGTDTAYGAAFRRSGVIRAETFGALLDFAAAFSFLPLPEGPRTLVITNAGGPGIMAVDAIDRAGLTPAFLQPDSTLALRPHLPDSATIYNPVDLGGDAGPVEYEAALGAAQTDRNIDSIVAIFVNRVTSRAAETAQALIRTWDRKKPLVVAFIGGEEIAGARNLLRPAGLPDYDSTEHAVAALKALHDYVSWKKRPPRIVTRFRVNRRRVERIISRRLLTRRLQVSAMKAKNILQAYGFNVPAGTLATTVEEAVEAAERIGYPVAMKIASPDITHKSAIGGVRLNLTNRSAIHDAFDLMMLRIREHAPAAWIDGVCIEKMIDRGSEVILGMSRDLQFGPMLMFGLGGIFVEVLKDVAFHLAPITFDEAVQMLSSTRSYGMLMGSRGQDRIDIEAIARCLQRVSQLATDFPQVAELEINPLIVGEPGTEPSVADARILLKPDSPTP